MGKDNGRQVSRAIGKPAVSSGIARLRGDATKPSDGLLLLGGHSELGEVLDGLLETGDAVIIGRTRDGGALCFTILSGSEREKLYAGTTVELEALLDAIRAAYLD